MSAPMVTATCGVCCAKFQVSSTRAKHGRGKHCSPACQYEARRRLPKSRVSRVCVGCGRTFEIEPAKLCTTRRGAGTYCSRPCRDKNRVGDLHPQFLGPRERTDYGTNWQAQKRRARKRDGCCKRCGTTEGPLAVHHKIPIRLWSDKEAANDLSNLVCLCESCHRTVEAETTWQPIDGGVIGYRTGGAGYQLAASREMLPRDVRRTAGDSEETRLLLAADALFMQALADNPRRRDFDEMLREADSAVREGREFVPRESLRAADPPKQASLFTEVG